MNEQRPGGLGEEACCACAARTASESAAASSSERASLNRAGKISSSTSPILLSLLVAFLPKCALCWGAYLALFNSLGIVAFQYPPWLKDAFAVTLVASIIMFYRAASRRQMWLPFWMQLLGIACVMVAQYLTPSLLLNWMGIALLSTGTFVSASRGLPKFSRAHRRFATIPLSES